MLCDLRQEGGSVRCNRGDSRVLHCLLVKVVRLAWHPVAAPRLSGEHRRWTFRASADQQPSSGCKTFCQDDVMLLLFVSVVALSLLSNLLAVTAHGRWRQQIARL